jgi:hypothetical protein
MDDHGRSRAETCCWVLGSLAVPLAYSTSMGRIPYSQSNLDELGSFWMDEKA